MIKPNILGDDSLGPDDEPDITVDYHDDVDMRASRLTIAGEREPVNTSGNEQDPFMKNNHDISHTEMPYLTN